MITPLFTNIMLLTIPRTGTQFMHNFLFEGAGRIVPMNLNTWFKGKNPISYPIDHCLIVEHFHPTVMPLVYQALSIDPNMKVIIPMRDLMASMISADLMNHRGFFVGIDSFIDSITIIPHHKIRMDISTPFIAELNKVISFSGIKNHPSINKYALKPVINSVRPETVSSLNIKDSLLQAKYDSLQAALKNKNVNLIRTILPGSYDKLISKKFLLSNPLFDFGYTTGDLPWIL